MNLRNTICNFLDFNNFKHLASLVMTPKFLSFEIHHCIWTSSLHHEVLSNGFKYRVSMSIFCLSHNLVYLLCFCPSLDKRLVNCVAERVKEPRFYGDHVFNSHPHRKRCCVLWYDALRWLSLLGGCKLATNSLVKETTGKLGNGQLLSGFGFVQNIAPPSLSRDRRIKMEQTNTKIIPLTKDDLVKLLFWKSLKKSQSKLQ